MKLTTHLHLVLRLQMSRAIPQFPYIPSWFDQGQLWILSDRKFNLKQLSVNCWPTLHSQGTMVLLKVCVCVCVVLRSCVLNFTTGLGMTPYCCMLHCTVAWGLSSSLKTLCEAMHIFSRIRVLDRHSDGGSYSISVSFAILLRLEKCSWR